MRIDCKGIGDRPAARMWPHADGRVPVRRPAGRAGFGVTLLLLMLAGFWGCADEPPRESSSGTPAELPDQELFDYTVSDTRDGSRRWILRSARMEKFKDKDDARLYGVNMDFFRADTLFSTLVSEDGEVNLTTNKLFAWGNVVVTTVDGRKLETQELLYDDQSGKISNEVHNRFTRKDDIMIGYGMETTPDLGDFTLHRVEAVIYDTEEDGNDDASR